jgi:hypothetical protein
MSGAIKIIFPDLDPDGGPEERGKGHGLSTMVVGAETSWLQRSSRLPEVEKKEVRLLRTRSPREKAWRGEWAAAQAQCVEENTTKGR